MLLERETMHNRQVGVPYTLPAHDIRVYPIIMGRCAHPRTLAVCARVALA